MSTVEALATPSDSYGHGGDIERKLRAKVAQALLLQGSSAAPVQHWTQGAARLAQALSGGQMLGQISADQAREDAGISALLSKAIDAQVGGEPMPQPTMQPRPSTAAALVGPPEPPAAPSPYALNSMTPRDSQDTFRTPLDAMAPRQTATDALKTAYAAAGQAPQAPPAMSNPTPAGAVPVQTQSIKPPAPEVVAQAAPQPSMPPGISRKDAETIKALIANRATRDYGMKMLETQTNKLAERQPTFGVIGEDQFGNKQHGWIDPFRRTVTPANPPTQTAQGAVTITGPNGDKITVPEGQDPKKFREHITTISADAAGGKMTEVQAKDSKFANKMLLSEQTLRKLEGQGLSETGRASENIPTILGVQPGKYTQSKEYQSYTQARDNFITALLRDESGAAIGTQEYKRYEREFFPQPGEGPDVIEQKRRARQVAIESMIQSAGPAYKAAPSLKGGGGNKTKTGVTWSVE